MRWKANSFASTSYVMASINTWIMAARLIRAPRVAVRGTISSNPPASIGAAGEDFISRG